MPGSGLPCAPDTLPEKLTRRGTTADCPDGDACCALVTEQKNNNENTAVQASRYFPPFMTVSPFLRVALSHQTLRSRNRRSLVRAIPPPRNRARRPRSTYPLFRSYFLEPRSCYFRSYVA